MPKFGHEHIGGEKRGKKNKNTEANLPKEINLNKET